MRKTIAISAPMMTAEEIDAVIAVLKSGRLAQGPRVKEFENKFASYIGARYAIAVNSGTAALHTALLAHGVGKDDEVITTPFSFIATGNSILYCGARPVFVDIDRKTFNLDPDMLKARITPRTRAVLPVHLYGQPCGMTAIADICRQHGLALIEDVAQGVGAEYHGMKAGSFGTGCFSFYATKNMSTGEGGMITTSDQKVAENAISIREHGQKGRYNHEVLGYNYRMTEVAAAIGMVQLAKLDAFNERRMSNARTLTRELSGVKGLATPPIMADLKHVFHQYTVRIDRSFPVKRDELKSLLEQEGIDSGIYYPVSIHQHPLYKKLGYDVSLPVAESASQEVLSLPVHPSLTEEDLSRIGETVRGIATRRVSR